MEFAPHEFIESAELLCQTVDLLDIIQGRRLGLFPRRGECRLFRATVVVVVVVEEELVEIRPPMFHWGKKIISDICILADLCCISHWSCISARTALRLSEKLFSKMSISCLTTAISSFLELLCIGG